MAIPTRRTVLWAAAGFSALTLAGCGSDSAFEEADGNASPSGSGAADGAEEAVFPATVKHKYGTTTIPKKPLRVAVVGYSDQDFVLAFGFKPVLVRDWYGPDMVIMPWAKEAAGDLAIKGTNLGSDAIDVEKVADTNPDLIIGVYSGMTQADYDKLSKFAPVIAQEAEFIDYGEPWQNVTIQIGTALGQPKKAAQLVADLEKKFADTKAANPQWADQTVAVATFDGKNNLSTFASEDPRSRFMRDLGFSISPEVDKAAGKQFYTQVPLEKASMIDADLLVWDQLSFTEGGKATIAKTPSLANLKAMTENRAVYLEPQDVEGAFGWQTILSLPYALEKVRPMLEKAAPKK